MKKSQNVILYGSTGAETFFCTYQSPWHLMRQRFIFVKADLVITLTVRGKESGSDIPDNVKS